MAEKLARMYGTEEDKVNCPFYFKIGACRYGDKCLRIHNKPPYSQTLIVRKMYQNTPIELALASGNQVSEQDAKTALQHFEDFYEEVFMELANYGEIEDLIVCDNVGEHLLGAVYIKFSREDDAMKCMEALRNRYYDGRILVPEYSPVSDFSNAKCKQFIEGQCKRGGYCNYMHLKPVAAKFKRDLYRQMYDDHPEYRRSRRSRSRSERKKKKKSKKHSRSRSRSHKKDKKKDKKRQKSRSSSVRSNMNSEERRAMIAQWNNADDEPAAQDQNQQQQQQQENQAGQQQQQGGMPQLAGLDYAQLAQQQALLQPPQQQQQQVPQLQQQQLQQQLGHPALEISNLQPQLNNHMQQQQQQYQQ